MKRLVLLGAGHAHVEVVRALAAAPIANTSITLISETQSAGYSGMMPGVIAGHYQRAEAEINLSALCARAGIAFVCARLGAVHAHEAHTDRARFSFDIASVNTGSQPWLPPEATGLHLGVKPFGTFLDALPELAARRRIVVVGGGAAAIEVVLALQHRFGAHTRCALACATRQILQGFTPRTVAMIERTLADRGVAVLRDAQVIAAQPDHLALANGARIECDASVWATGARPHPYLAVSALARARDGFIAVNPAQQSISHPHIFAVGDCATRPADWALPKSGVIPVRQGLWLTAQLANALAGRPIMPFESSANALALLALGEQHCIGQKGAFSFKGPWVWHWKNWIDRRWMAKYHVETQ